MSLQTFTLDDLAPFVAEKGFPANASRDFRLLEVGVDDVHEALKFVLSQVTRSLYCNAYGYDDEALNTILMGLVKNPAVTVLITLDKSQAGGTHEKKLLDADRAEALAAFNTHFAIGQSATHQISHTKGFVADGIVGAEGSTNWSTAGEGTFVVKGQPGGTGYRAQNNTQTLFTCPYAIARFQARLIAEHMIAKAQQDQVPMERRQRALPGISQPPETSA